MLVFKCSKCSQINDLIVCSKCNTILCCECHNAHQCSICDNNIFYNINKEIIYDSTIDFINLKFSVGFCGFDRIDKSLMDILNSINQNQSFDIDKNDFNKNIKLIIFPNKIQSIKFSRKLINSNSEDEFAKQSKYRIVYTPKYTFYLLNFENVKSNEISFIIKLLFSQNFNPDNVLSYFEIYQHIPYQAMKIMNKRMGIDYVYLHEIDHYKSYDFFINCYKHFHEYLAYKKLSIDNPLDLLNYLQYKIDLDSLSSLNDSSWFYVDDLFSLYIYILNMKFIEKSVKCEDKINVILSDQLNQKIERAKYIFNNNEMRGIISNFISDIETQNIDTIQNYFNFIESSINNIFAQCPLIFLRYWEIIDLLKHSQNLISETQSLLFEYPNTKIIPNLSEILKFIFKLNTILSFNIPIQYRIMLLNAKFDILKEIVIRNNNKNYFDLLLETNREFETLFLQYHNKLKTDELFKMNFADVLIERSAIAYLYFIFNDSKNAEKILHKNKEMFDVYDIPDFLKISILYVNFQFFEDYDDLKEIHRICLNSPIDESEYIIDPYFSNVDEVVCKFSCFFSNNKGNLLEILNLIEDQIILPPPIIKNYFEKMGLEIFIGIFYHIINANKQDSVVLLLSEVKNALKLAETQNEINNRNYPYDYYLLKTRAIEEILNENVEEIKKIVLQIEKYNGSLKSKENFKTALNYWLDSTLKSYNKNIEILINLGDADDPWCNLIYKIVKRKISQNLYNEAESELESVKKITNIREQLIKFKEVVERNCINAFWDSRIKGKLQPYPEEIGKSILVTFFYASEFYSYIGTENEEGVGKCDILTISKRNEKNIFELKIVKSISDINKGIKELLYYMSKETLDEGYLILFDSRKRNHKIDDEIIKDGKKINVISLKINDIAPSK